MTSNHTTQHPARLSIGIIGGGIGGVALAIGLSRDQNLDVCLFEAAPRFSEIGAGVSFGPNAVRAISLLGLEEAYRSIADASPAPYEDVWFEWRRGEDDAYLTASLAPGCGQSSVHRADFLDALVQHLPEGVARFGKRCVAVHQDDAGAVVDFEDGSRFRCDVLIGFDGIKSVVREHVLPPGHYGHLCPRWSGTQAYRGLVPTAQLIAAFEASGVEPRLATVPQMYLGKDRHLLTFPVKQAELINVVAFVTDRSSPDPQLPAGAPWVVEVSQQEMLDDFAGWGAASRTLLGCIEHPTRWALHDLPPLPRYARGRVILVGDAAHATLPHQGAGAGQALEDAYVLSRLLTDSRSDRGSVPEILEAFEACRHQRACRVQTTSRQAGDVYEFRGAATGDDTQKLAADLETRFDWLWNHDPEVSVRTAKAALGWRQVTRNGGSREEAVPVAQAR